ncbi:unnamed protein product [Tuber aestivum]|uniref:Uncharacterized protein n=1 Tax=Tuber aestivum TaxID=59557 RepID=A0A292Q939_9PEZI|nr:unnamed protein product [Tuber aestivum]
MSYHPTARSAAMACHTSYPLTDEEIASAPAIYTPVIRPTHISTSYAHSACSSTSDVSPFFYEGIWLEGPDVPQDATTEQTPLLSAPVPFDPELDGFQLSTTDCVSLKSRDLESGTHAQVEEVMGVREGLFSVIGGLWRWILRFFQCCGLPFSTGTGGGN